MNKDVTEFIDQLNGVASELKQHVTESETLILSKNEVDEFSKLFISSATVLAAADKAFVVQKRVSYFFAGLATLGFSLLIPTSLIVFPLSYPSTSAQSSHSLQILHPRQDSSLSLKNLPIQSPQPQRNRLSQP